jgi:tetratricopeptide (TPR) repeat protein
LMVIFEDLHWIDDETQAFLNLVADSIGTAKILLLVNYRPEYSHGWGSKTYYTQLRLDPLAKESADEMLQSLLGDSAELGQLKRLIIERTEGNPFFMEETVELLLDDGALVHNERIKLVKPLAELKIPPTVQAILASRIDRLPPDEKDLLQTLAVIGKEFPVGLVKRVVAKYDDELSRMLQALQLAEFIYEQPAAGDIEYTFKHALTQEVASQSVLVERKKPLHERIGAAIEASFAQSIDDHLSQLAHHYGRSSNTEKAVEYLDRAGQQAMMRGALKEAELSLKQAIATLSTIPETLERAQREFDLQSRLQFLLSLTSGYATAETAEATRRLRELGEKSGNPAQLFSALLGLWSPAYGRGELTAMQQIGDQMLEIAEGIGSSDVLTVAHMSQGFSRAVRGDFIGAAKHFEASIASYKEDEFSTFTVDPHVGALYGLGLASQALGLADRGRAQIHDAISLAERLKKPVSLIYALVGACFFYEILREPGKAQEAAERLFALASTQQIPDQVAYAAVFRGWAMAEQGRTDEGIALIRAGLEHYVALGLRLNPGMYLSMLSEAQARAGQEEDALATIEQAVATVGEWQIDLFFVLLWRGELRLRQGDETKAAGDFQEAIAASRHMSAKTFELRATTSLARLLMKQGKRNEARTMLAEIYNWFTEGFDTADLKDAEFLLDELSP